MHGFVHRKQIVLGHRSQTQNNGCGCLQDAPSLSLWLASVQPCIYDAHFSPWENLMGNPWKSTTREHLLPAKCGHDKRPMSFAPSSPQPHLGRQKQLAGGSKHCPVGWVRGCWNSKPFQTTNRISKAPVAKNWQPMHITSKSRASRSAEVSNYKKCTAIGPQQKFCL